MLNGLFADWNEVYPWLSARFVIGRLTRMIIGALSSHNALRNQDKAYP